MIRDATNDDIDRLLDMGEMFFNESGYGDIASYDKASFEITLRDLIGLDNGVCVVSELDGCIYGMAGGLIYPFYFNNNHITGQELFWWMSPDKRGTTDSVRMFKALENKARKVGAKSFSMIALDKVNPDVVGNMYKRRGYRGSDHGYIRSL